MTNYFANVFTPLGQGHGPLGSLAQLASAGPPRTAQQQAFNLPAYQRHSLNPQSWQEMTRANQDSYLGQMAGATTDLARQISANSAQQQMQRAYAAMPYMNQLFAGVFGGGGAF